MIYELGLAQLMSSLFGNTILRYSTTLAIYIFCMGIGSFLYKESKHTDDLRFLYWTEVFMAVLGIFAPIAFVFGNYFFIKFFGFQSAAWPVLIFTHLYIAICGTICGYEIPLISSLLKKDQNLVSLKIKTDSLVLSMDYVGMFLASVLFPFFLIPHWGLLGAFWTAGILNLICVLIVAQKMRLSFLDKKNLIVYMIGFVLVLSLFGSQYFENILSRIYAKSF